MSVDDRRILNCGKEAPGWSVRLLRPCALTWGQLEDTGEARVRYCGDCEHLVYKVANRAEARARALQGECLAVPPTVYDTVHARSEPRREGVIAVGFFSPELFLDEVMGED